VIDHKALEYLNPGKDIEEIIRDRAGRHAELMKRLPPYAWIKTPQAKGQGGEKRKTT
jgi:hypothetical protein